jgi:hypothetical protein
MRSIPEKSPPRAAMPAARTVVRAYAEPDVVLLEPDGAGRIVEPRTQRLLRSG